VFPYGTAKRFIGQCSFTFNFSFFYNSRRITLKEALDIAYDDAESDTELSAIYIEPPECNILTEEDSADEDDAGFVLVNKTRIGVDRDASEAEPSTRTAPNISITSIPRATPSTTTTPLHSGVTITMRPQNSNFSILGELEPSYRRL
jgi:hypothetical protein